MSDKRAIIISGLFLGLLGVLLVKAGNPANMGICVACFIRDIAGGLGLHRAEVVQYIRPEIPGFILGSFLTAAIFGEFRARGGSSPLLRFFIGIGIMLGAMVFLGCPLRMLLRLGAGDLNAFVGLFGFITGIFGGVYFLRRGFSLGRAHKISKANSAVMPITAIALLALVFFAPAFIYFSEAGPGSLRAPLFISLFAGMAVGAAVQRSRLCQIGCFRDLILVKDPHLLYGSLAILTAAFFGNLYFGYFNLGFEGQPVAHAESLWNFLGLAVVGLGATLLGGCPLRQVVMAAEGDTDAAMTFLGLIAGGAIAHNFGLAASPAGVGASAKIGLLIAGGLLLFLGYYVTLPVKQILSERVKNFEQKQ